MSVARVQYVAVVVAVLLLAAATIGYFLSPGGMLSVVGIDETPLATFLVRALAAAFLAMLPAAWIARRRTGSAIERGVLAGLAIYMFAGSAVDLAAYTGGLVGPAALPSIAFRVALGATIGWTAFHQSRG